MNKDIIPGPVSDVFLVSTCKVLRTADKRPYTLLELRDKSGIIKAFVWDKQLTYLRPGMFIKASGLAKEHDGAIILKFEETSITPVKQPLNLDNYIYSLDSLTLNKLWEELLGLVDGVYDKYYKSVLKMLLDRHETFGEFSLRNCPLTDERYGSYAGALLEHIIYCCRHAKTIQHNYYDRNTPIDPDLLVSILILHDIGRLQGLTNIFSVEKSRLGNLLSMPVLSFNITRELCDKVEEKDEIKSLKLAQGVLEAGSKESTKFLEAMLAQRIQEMDALVGIYSRSINFAKSDQEFIDSDILGIKLWNTR